ncbi:MAG: hypothetical protein K1060chlam2_01067 [Chlamydiae bacterium]|nr:hypothetical protein [Chlamydiota bacterium]
MRIFLCLFFYLFSFQSFAEDDTRHFDLPDLELFTFEGSGSIEIQQGEKNLLILKGDRAEVEIDQGRLTVSQAEGVEGKLIVRDLKRIHLEGSVAVDIDRLEGESLMVEMGGEGESLLEGTIDLKHLALIVRAGDRVLLRGRVGEAMVYMEGSAMFEDDELIAENSITWVSE